jgi:hypothetical protein
MQPRPLKGDTVPLFAFVLRRFVRNKVMEFQISIQAILGLIVAAYRLMKRGPPPRNRILSIAKALLFNWSIQEPNYVGSWPEGQLQPNSSGAIFSRPLASLDEAEEDLPGLNHKRGIPG